MAEKVKLPGSDAERDKKLGCYFSLLSQDDNIIWFQASGYSMLPLFWPSCRVRMNTDFTSPEIGQVVVFADAKKLIAHRVVDRDAQTRRWVTKGDTLCFFDSPIRQEDIFGFVDFIDQNGKRLWVGSDPAVAALSARLGRVLQNRLRFLPKRLKLVVYYLIFFPCFTYIQFSKASRSL